MMNDLISRQTAIDALVDGALINYQAAGHNNGLVKAIDVIMGLPSVQPEQRWIPCSEMLPEAEKKYYWVCTDTGYQCQCRWTNINHIWTDLTTEWHWHIMDIPQYSKVIAWMALPEPYRKGGDM